MNTYLVAAAAVAFFIGLAHSILGGYLVFTKLRQGQLVPTNGGNILSRSNVRILWASWHVATVFGWLAAAALMFLAVNTVPQSALLFLLSASGVAMLVASLLVFYSTKGRHPGWVGMLVVTALCYLGYST